MEAQGISYPPIIERIEQVREQDARRAVACVNACAEFSTEALESGVLAELIEAVTELSTTTGGLDYSVLAQLARRKLRPALAKLKGE